MIDEIPILAVAAACAEGTTVFEGLRELRIKETDRLETIQFELTQLGVAIEAYEDSLIVHGGPIAGGDVSSHGDHRIGMACAVAALVSESSTHIGWWEAVSTSYPDFMNDLKCLSGEGV
jgi:3-phosphoshikimate 1-carboxyvinyltransferase